MLRGRRKHEKKDLLKIVLITFTFLLFVLFLYYQAQTTTNNQNNFFTLENELEKSRLICEKFSNFPLQQTKQQKTEEFQLKKKYKVEIDFTILPHPEKRDINGGEDAIFISKDKYSFGVADGVGGWTFSEGKREPLEILCKAEEEVKTIMGSSTACFITIEGEFLKAVNIGDSAFLLLRDRSIYFASSEQLHSFNFPYQIGTYGDGLDNAQIIEIPIKENDIIILGSDGLFDNLFEDQILNLLFDDQMINEKAKYIADLAMEFAMSESAFTPFTKNALENNLYHKGGKLDDISVIVANILKLN